MSILNLKKKQTGNRPPDRKEIERLLVEYREKKEEADLDLEKADQDIYNYKLALVKAELATAPKDALSRSPTVFLEFENDRNYEDLEHKRKMAIGDQSDWDRRINLLEAALRAVGGG